MIVAGKKSEVYWGEGNWIILDIGFSNDGKTCGFALGDETTRLLRFGETRKLIIDQIMKQKGRVNLVIEAPLSVCFDLRRNPKGRSVEKQDLNSRYWYVGPGCVVMTAAMYLIHDIHEAIKHSPSVEVRLFEGFVSFKKGASDHRKDVQDLREIVKNAHLWQDKIYDPGQLKQGETDEIVSAFRVAGLDCGVPAVIVA